VAGIQKLSNTQVLFDRAEALGVAYITPELMRKDYAGSIRKLNEFIDRMDQIYLTICLDVFNASFAPGVSAPNPLGIQPHDALELIRTVKASGKIIVADIAEMNPLFDIDQRTARLAASMVFELLVD
jgi:formiminoglutamase